MRQTDLNSGVNSVSQHPSLMKLCTTQADPITNTCQRGSPIASLHLHKVQRWGELRHSQQVCHNTFPPILPRRQRGIKPGNRRATQRWKPSNTLTTVRIRTSLTHQWPVEVWDKQHHISETCLFAKLFTFERTGAPPVASCRVEEGVVAQGTDFSWRLARKAEFPTQVPGKDNLFHTRWLSLCLSGLFCWSVSQPHFNIAQLGAIFSASLLP
jgi:hypothetical protein